MREQSIDEASQAEARPEENKSFIGEFKRRTRHKPSVVERIRIVLEGICQSSGQRTLL